MAKLSQQIEQKQQETPLEKRPTRTERLKRQQKFQREKARYEKLREEAERIKQEEFKEKEKTEKKEVPDWDKIGNFRKDKWRGYSKDTKERLMKIWRREGKTKKVNVKKTVPFTLEGEHSYTKKYEGLSDDLKKFFPSP